MKCFQQAKYMHEKSDVPKNENSVLKASLGFYMPSLISFLGVAWLRFFTDKSEKRLVQLASALTHQM